MIIQSVHLENIRSYKKEEIYFENGISLLSGDIGSGKSTVLQAIEFALLGFKRGDLEGIQLLRKGTTEGNVKLILEDSKTSSKVEIFRKLKKSKNSQNISQENGYLKFNNKLVEMSPSELNAYVFEIMNFPKEFITKDKNLFYRFTIYTAQEQLKEILFADPEKRLELLRKLFKIDKYKQLKQAISLYIQYTKVKKKELETKIETQKEIEEEIKNIKKELKETQDEEVIAKKNQKNVLEKIELCNLKLKKIKNAKKKYNETILKLEKALSSLESYSKQKETLQKELEENKKELKNSKSQDLEKRKEETLKKLKDTKEELNIVLKTIEKNNKLIEEFDLKKKKTNEIKDKLSQIDNKKETLKQLKNSFDYMLTKCRLKDTQVQIKKLLSKSNGIEKKKKVFEKNKEDKKEYELKIEIHDENLKTVEEKLKNFNSLKECPCCFREITSTNRKQIFSHIQEQKQEINKEKNILKDNLDKIRNELRNVEKIIEEYELISDKILELKEKEKYLSEQEKKERIQFEKQRELQKEIETLEKENNKNKLEKLTRELLGEEKIILENQKLTDKEKKLQSNILNISVEIEKQKNFQKEFLLLEKTISQKEKKIEEIEKQLEKKEKFEKQLKTYLNEQTKLSNKEEEIINYKEKFEKNEKEVSNIIAMCLSKKTEKEKYLIKFEEQLKTIFEIKKKYEKIIEIETFLSTKAYKIVDTLERHLFTSFYLDFNESFEYYFKQLIEDNEIEIRLDEEFTPLIELNGHDVSINTLSGGEKSSLAIAYRLGLKKIIEDNIKENSTLNLLILDEPTDGFSSEQIDRLGILLKESNVEQTLLVSHDEKLESIAQNVLRVNKLNHISKVE